MVQVSSQKNEADAQASYRALQGKYPSVLGSQSPVVKRVDLGEKGVYYRALVGPFSSADQATQFCSNLKAAGGRSASSKEINGRFLDPMSLMRPNRPHGEPRIHHRRIGTELTAAEREFIRAERPWGFILFKRNIETPAQVSALVAELRDIVGDADAPVLIDQEGGRVQRLGPPHWPVYPPGAVFGALYDIDPQLGLTAARLSSRLIAADLIDLGINVDCLPLADVPVPGADAVIGNRAYGTEPDKVAAIARAVTEGLEQGGVLPVLKHIPGHGRATADSHFRLPTVDTPRAELERTDFAAFQPLADLPMAMTAHVVFSALDPAHPATTSATIIEQVIRGAIGFQGLLMSDDVSMNALAGSIAERTRAIVAAGCDMVLHCNGNLEEMREVAGETPELTGQALQRAERALAARKPPLAFDRQAARAELDALVERVGAA